MVFPRGKGCAPNGFSVMPPVDSVAPPVTPANRSPASKLPERKRLGATRSREGERYWGAGMIETMGPVSYRLVKGKVSRSQQGVRTLLPPGFRMHCTDYSDRGQSSDPSEQTVPNSFPHPGVDFIWCDHFPDLDRRGPGPSRQVGFGHRRAAGRGGTRKPTALDCARA